MDIDQKDDVIERPKWDGFWLLFWGVVASIAAWAFWHYSGEYGFLIIQVAVFGSLIYENRKLKKELNALKMQD